MSRPSNLVLKTQNGMLKSVSPKAFRSFLRDLSRGVTGSTLEGKDLGVVSYDTTVLTPERATQLLREITPKAEVETDLETPTVTPPAPTTT